VIEILLNFSNGVQNFLQLHREWTSPSIDSSVVDTTSRTVVNILCLSIAKVDWILACHHNKTPPLAEGLSYLCLCVVYNKPHRKTCDVQKHIPSTNPSSTFEILSKIQDEYLGTRSRRKACIDVYFWQIRLACSPCIYCSTVTPYSLEAGWEQYTPLSSTSAINTSVADC